MLQKIGQTLNKFRSMPNELRKVMNKELQKKQEIEESKSSTNKPAVNNVKMEQRTAQGELTSAAILAKIGKDKKLIDSNTSNNEYKLSNNHNQIKSKAIKTMDDFKYPEHYSEKYDEMTIDEKALIEKMKEIQQDLSEALAHWNWTKHAYDHAVGFEQVEYCIYQMMAAEQKYRMILLKARNMNVDWSKVKGDMI